MVRTTSSSAVLRELTTKPVCSFLRVIRPTCRGFDQVLRDPVLAARRAAAASGEAAEYDWSRLARRVLRVHETVLSERIERARRCRGTRHRSPSALMRPSLGGESFEPRCHGLCGPARTGPARDPHDVVSGGFEHVHDVTADPSGCPCHRDLPCLHPHSPLSLRLSCLGRTAEPDGDSCLLRSPIRPG
jgi:hypothetical protein